MEAIDFLREKLENTSDDMPALKEMMVQQIKDLQEINNEKLKYKL